MCFKIGEFDQFKFDYQVNLLINLKNYLYFNFYNAWNIKFNLTLKLKNFISSNKIGTEGAVKLCEGVSNLKNLTSLKLAIL